jgi:threonine/homoserine/homoserine lactone efflux protein
MSAFFQGLIIGFSIAVPVGPVGLLCLRRSLTDGRVAGLVSGLGAATADALYGMIAALGLTAVTHLLIEHQRPLQLGGGLFLLYLGLTTLRAKPPAIEARAATASNLRAAYLSTVVLTLANPMTILSFLGIFAGLGAGTARGTPLAAFTLVLGVFLGSAAWWLILSFTAAAFGARLQRGGLRILHVASGVVLGAFGLWQLSRLV